MEKNGVLEEHDDVSTVTKPAPEAGDMHPDDPTHRADDANLTSLTHYFSCDRTKPEQLQKAEVRVWGNMRFPPWKQRRKSRPEPGLQRIPYNQLRTYVS